VRGAGSITASRIRPYIPADAPACVAIFERAWNAGHPYSPRTINAADFAAETADETILVAEDERGHVLGFVSLYKPECFVHHLYVDPAHARNGIGKALLAAAVALAGGQASLKCQTRNAGALAFYRRLGWSDGETGDSDAGPWIRMLGPR
jgi:ribosomal protein S18 acetylase RimI-like enzyme